MFSSLLKKKKVRSHFRVDFHSHLIPGIDDGVGDAEETIEILTYFSGLGYEKMITTPHIHAEYFPNSEENILEQYKILKDTLKERELNIELEVAAEYYVDESFQEKVANNKQLLTFGGNYVLIETSFINKPLNLKAVIFELQSKGYKVILAHPERYLYLQEHLEEVNGLRKQGVYFQLNLGSLAGVYSSQVKKFAEQLISKRCVDFIGSDCHNRNQLDVIQRAIQGNLYKKLIKLPILNDSLV